MSLDRRQGRDGHPVARVPYDMPAPSVTAAAGRSQWVRREDEGGGMADDEQPVMRTGQVSTNNGTGDQHDYERDIDRPSPSVTTRGDRWALLWPGADRSHGSSAMMANSIRVELAELAILQDFPAGDHELGDGSRCGWPFQGTRSDQAKQIGNSVPAGLAEAIVRAITGQENPHA